MNTSISFGQYLKSLNTIFYAMIGGAILLAFATIYLVGARLTLKNENLDIVFKYALPILGFGLVMAALVFYKIKLRTIKATDSLFVKLLKFRQAFIIKYAFLQVIVLSSLYASISTHNYQYLIIFILAIAIMIMAKPSPGNIAAGLKLGEEEILAISGGAIMARPLKERPLLIRYPLLAVVLISFSLYSAYDVILGIIKREEWTMEEREQMVHDCILKAKDTAAKHPEEVKAYCECTNEAIFRKFTHREIWENNQLSSEDLMKTLTPVFAECLNELRARIKEAESK
jgi:hypothetical protein